MIIAYFDKNNFVNKNYIVNPLTGRNILVGGAVYNKLLKDSKIKSKVLNAKVFTNGEMTSKNNPYIKNKTKSAPSKTKTAGCSNAGKYKGLKDSDFCGPSGGSCPGTYPVNTPQRARAALSYSRFAPNPKGIKDCVYEKAKSKGWLRNGKIKMTLL